MGNSASNTYANPTKKGAEKLRAFKSKKTVPLRASVVDSKSVEFALDLDDSASPNDEVQREKNKVSIEFNLEQLLEASCSLLKARENESSLSQKEIAAALETYHELTRILTLATRTGDWMSLPSDGEATAPVEQQAYEEKFETFVQEFDTAEQVLQKTLASHPAIVRPLSLSVVEREVTRDLFILDNSLRETTVGAPKGHSLVEKYRIVDAMAKGSSSNKDAESHTNSHFDTGITEVILGAFGSKISVDSQIAARWKSLGQSFDSTWGFSEAYDFAGYDEKPLWDALPQFLDQVGTGQVGPGADSFSFVTPPAEPLLKYSKEDIALVERAAEGFPPDAFGGKKIKQVLKESVSKDHGRVPLGLIMMAGYGICNAIVEVDTTLETFDYTKYNVVERCKFLLQWCEDNLPKRQSGPAGQDNSPRVLVNLRDFTNFQRTPSGLKNALHLVDSLCRLPTSIRPFGFMMEEPSGWLLPDEVGKLCRMVRLTMQRAGFPQGRFLVHVHMAFGMADATQLACLANGADGVWAALSRTGAQVGHACSTITAVNLFRLGHQEVAQKYNLANMIRAARAVTETTTRAPCPTHEEVYGELAFDIPYVMTNLPACRYTLALLVKELGIDRTVRLNELSSPYAVMMAMHQQFGPAEEIGWDPKVCPAMWDAIHNHLMVGLSRNYNSKIGLGHLYGLASQKALPVKMVAIMMKDSTVSDNHPTVLEFIQRWNQLCLHYEGKPLPPHPSQASGSIMLWNTDYATSPLRISLPFDFYKADHIRNPDTMKLPKLLRLYMLRNVVRDESKIQKTRAPMVNFYDQVMRLKLFIQEAEDKGFLPVVDDFCLQRGLEAMFDDEYAWLNEKRGMRGKVFRKKVFKIMQKQVGGKFLQMAQEQAAMDCNTAWRRQWDYVENRITEDQEIGDGMQDIRKELKKYRHLKLLPPDDSAQMGESFQGFNAAHREIIRSLVDAEDSNEFSEEFDSMFLAEEGLDNEATKELELAYFGESKDAKAQKLLEKLDDDEIWV